MLKHIRGLTSRVNVALDRVVGTSGEVSRKWTNLMHLKLFYGIIFTGVVSREYAFWADGQLSAMPEPMIRSEQFVLSVLIHYPQYLLNGIFYGLIALFLLNLLVNLWLNLSSRQCRGLMNKEALSTESGKTEVPHD